MKPAHALFAALLLGLVGTAGAQEAVAPEETPLVSTKTRAEVVAEVLEARAAGQLNTGERAMPVDASAPAMARTREEVRAEAREAQRLGLIAHGEGDTPVATAEQAVSIAEAGRRAAGARLAEKQDAWPHP
ncbi:MAG TPA: DUF4148 domain-containing protein [Burkholderiaceae bacterium]|nr:DUF4148 domain-containing protein [Burkholderiaceae bacterium]